MCIHNRTWDEYNGRWDYNGRVCTLWYSSPTTHCELCNVDEVCYLLLPRVRFQLKLTSLTFIGLTDTTLQWVNWVSGVYLLSCVITSVSWVWCCRCVQTCGCWRQWKKLKNRLRQSRLVSVCCRCVSFIQCNGVTDSVSWSLCSRCALQLMLVKFYITTSSLLIRFFIT